MSRSSAQTTRASLLKGFTIDRHYRYAATVAGVGILGALIVSLFVVRPLVGRLVHDTQDLNNKRVELSELKQKKKDLALLKQHYTALGEIRRQKVMVALPVDSDASHLISAVETIGGQHGVQVRSVVPSDGGTPAAAPEVGATTTPVPAASPSLPVSITVRGSYAGILAFMVGLEQAPRLMDIASVSFSGSGNPLEAVINVNAYYQPPGSGS